VGINTAILGRSRGGEAKVAAAAPRDRLCDSINMVKHCFPMLMRDGHVTRSASGCASATCASSRRMCARIQADRRQGRDHSIHLPGGPADKAGLNPAT